MNTFVEYWSAWDSINSEENETRSTETDQKLEQVLASLDSIYRQLSVLTQESIERNVADPLFKDLVGLLNGLGADWDELGHFFDFYGLELIRPVEGELLLPKEHQPIEKQVTPDAFRHGRVFRIFQPGLKRSDRVVATAKVSVLVHGEQ